MSTAKAIDASHLARLSRIPKGCTALTGDCTCPRCTLAHADRESPTNLGGTWIRKRGTRVWRPTP